MERGGGRSLSLPRGFASSNRPAVPPLFLPPQSDAALPSTPTTPPAEAIPAGPADTTTTTTNPSLPPTLPAAHARIRDREAALQSAGVARAAAEMAADAAADRAMDLALQVRALREGAGAGA